MYLTPNSFPSWSSPVREWYEYAMLSPNRLKRNCLISMPEIATHNHALVLTKPFLASQTAPVSCLNVDSIVAHHLMAGLLNSSTTLFWLKLVCFNKGAGEDEERDRFVYAGGKVENLPVPDIIVETMKGNRSDLADRLQTLSQACWERGREIPAMAMKKLFEKSGEAYHDWNSSLTGYVKPDSRLGKPFKTLDDLKAVFSNVCKIRDSLRSEMIALQEEMDWIVYEAYGLTQNADCRMPNDEVPKPLAREERPFVLWQQGGGDFEKAVELIPNGWTKDRKALWRARLEVIRDNEHIRRIEQPVYKRRWDEQWKVGNSWQCGPVAYDTEFVDAFEWWLSEKAEWWLEKKAGGPVELEKWSAEIWQDTRVQAAWGVVREVLERLGRCADFSRYFTTLVKEQSVPDNIPAAVPWEKIKIKIPPAVKRVRGKLNVPRERFHVTPDGQYIWAGVK